YQHRTFDRRDMTAMYMAADVVLVTALRDGMNLVAKEYVASRPDLRGVLVLSEFAGAADELRASVRVNPHDIAELKSAIRGPWRCRRRSRRTPWCPCVTRWSSTTCRPGRTPSSRSSNR